MTSRDQRTVPVKGDHDIKLQGIDVERDVLSPPAMQVAVGERRKSPVQRQRTSPRSSPRTSPGRRTPSPGAHGNLRRTPSPLSSPANFSATLQGRKSPANVNNMNFSYSIKRGGKSPDQMHVSRKKSGSPSSALSKSGGVVPMVSPSLTSSRNSASGGEARSHSYNNSKRFDQPNWVQNGRKLPSNLTAPPKANPEYGLASSLPRMGSWQEGDAPREATALDLQFLAEGGEDEAVLADRFLPSPSGNSGSGGPSRANSHTALLQPSDDLPSARSSVSGSGSGSAAAGLLEGWPDTFPYLQEMTSLATVEQLQSLLAAQKERLLRQQQQQQQHAVPPPPGAAAAAYPLPLSPSQTALHPQQQQQPQMGRPPSPQQQQQYQHHPLPPPSQLMPPHPAAMAGGAQQQQQRRSVGWLESMKSLLPTPMRPAPMAAAAAAAPAHGMTPSSATTTTTAAAAAAAAAAPAAQGGLYGGGGGGGYGRGGGGVVEVEAGGAGYAAGARDLQALEAEVVRQHRQLQLLEQQAVAAAAAQGAVPRHPRTMSMEELEAALPPHHSQHPSPQQNTRFLPGTRAPGSRMFVSAYGGAGEGGHYRSHGLAPASPASPFVPARPSPVPPTSSSSSASGGGGGGGGRHVGGREHRRSHSGGGASGGEGGSGSRAHRGAALTRGDTSGGAVGVGAGPGGPAVVPRLRIEALYSPRSDDPDVISPDLSRSVDRLGSPRSAFVKVPTSQRSSLSGSMSSRSRSTSRSTTPASTPRR